MRANLGRYYGLGLELSVRFFPFSTGTPSHRPGDGFSGVGQRFPQLPELRFRRSGASLGHRRLGIRPRCAAQPHQVNRRPKTRRRLDSPPSAAPATVPRNFPNDENAVRGPALPPPPARPERAFSSPNIHWIDGCGAWGVGRWRCPAQRPSRRRSKAKGGRCYTGQKRAVEPKKPSLVEPHSTTISLFIC